MVSPHDAPQSSSGTCASCMLLSSHRQRKPASPQIRSYTCLMCAEAGRWCASDISHGLANCFQIRTMRSCLIMARGGQLGEGDLQNSGRRQLSVEKGLHMRRMQKIDARCEPAFGPRRPEAAAGRVQLTARHLSQSAVMSAGCISWCQPDSGWVSAGELSIRLI
jgi:hypothetical protein